MGEKVDACGFAGRDEPEEADTIGGAEGGG